MSGHSKWSTIKRKKGANDAKRGAIFTRLSKDISLAAREGGEDPSMNSALRLAIKKAKSSNMPAANIERAIKKGTGQLEGVNYEEMIYEGYGPLGIAIYMEVITDNKNRTVSELRHILNKHNGSLAEPGSVSWMFKRVGLIIMSLSGRDEEKLMRDVLEVEADDFDIVGEEAYVSADQGKLTTVKEGLEKLGYDVKSAEIIMTPNSLQKIETSDKGKVLELMDLIDSHDDVNQVFSNFSFSE